MIRLPYRAFRNVKVAPRLTPPDGPSVRYRPIIPLRIIAPGSASRSVLVGDAFADPGCDVTVVQREFLRPLGPISFVHGMNHRWKGHDYSVRFAQLRLEIFDGATTITWPAPVGFTEAPIPYGCLLGLTGFFEFLDVHFLGSDRALEIEPNPLFHAVGGKSKPPA
jgi:hypothetical protein